MLGLDMLDVAIGVVFVFLLVSLIASAIAEYIESLLKKRSSDLEKGILEMLKNNEPLVKQLYEHPLISSLYKGDSHETAKKNGDLPSYIPARSFALAMMDLVLSDDDQSGCAGATPVNAPVSKPVVGDVVAPDGGQIVQNAAKIVEVSTNAVNALRQLATKNVPEGTTAKARIEKLPVDVAKTLVTLIDAAGGDASKVRANLEGWFDASMDRVSGWYKRRNHQILVGIGLLLAIAFNIDTIAIVQSLWMNKGMRDAAVAAASAFAQQEAQPGGKNAQQSDAKKAPAKAADQPAEQTVTAASATDTTASQTATDTTASQVATGTAPQAPTESVSQTATGTTASETAASGTTQTTSTTTTQVATNAPPATGTPTAPSQKEMNTQATDPEAAAIHKKIDRYATSLDALKLPIGWDEEMEKRPAGTNIICAAFMASPPHLIGWIITAAAVSFGAPFWFDALNKIMVIRSTVKPREKSAEEAPKERTTAGS